jgi:hypothetical protein
MRLSTSNKGETFLTPTDYKPSAIDLARRIESHRMTSRQTGRAARIFRIPKHVAPGVFW